VDTPTIAVFDPFPRLTITIERDADAADEVHLHAGGQGVWIARMASSLGAEVRLVTALGDESGAVISSLLAGEGIGVRRVGVRGRSASYVHDRRGGDRSELVATLPPTLSRHELDELYDVALVECSEASACLLAGPLPGVAFDADLYRRLVCDLGQLGTTVVGDLSGEALQAAVAGGVGIVKISHEELIEAGHAADDQIGEVARGMVGLRRSGAGTVVVSRAEDPTLALVGESLLEVVAPTFEAVEHRGGGDSMAAALAVGLARGYEMADALRLGAAAGALNATRRGLATGRGDHVLRLMDRCQVRRLSLPA
jgi:1-phosphofructokinase